MTTSEIIQCLGGPVKVSKYLNIRSQAVSQWSSKDTIPIARVPDLERLSRLLRLKIRAEHMRPDINWDALRLRK